MPRRADVMLSSEHAETQQGGVLDGIDHYQLPQSTVTRIAKSALPSNAKLQKESVLALVKGSTVFINYIGSSAQEVANARAHKTITSADVLQALELTDFGDMVPGLSAELEEYRARLKKNPPPVSQKPPSPTTNPANKGKGKGKVTGAKGKARPSNGQAVPGNDETPYSGSDIGDEEEGSDVEGNVEDEMDDGDLVEEGQDDDNDEPADVEDQMELDESDSGRDSGGKE
ncbi:histone-fold-containing protein [Serendipita vermifera]|nr:histone-fold-containing protein [Serendipita vermifera]